MALVSVTQLAKTLNVTPSRIQQLVSNEGMPKAARGKYDLGICMQWFIRWLQAALKARASEAPDGSMANASAEKVKQIRLENQRLEMDLASQRGELISADAVKLLIDGMTQMWVEGLEAVPQRSTPDPIVQKKIETEIRSVRQQWSDHLLRFAEHAREQHREKPNGRKKR